MKKITAIVSLTIICLTMATCRKKDVPKVDYANEMRKFVIEISEAAKAVDPDFLIIHFRFLSIYDCISIVLSW